MMDKSQEAEKIIKKHVLYATAAGLVPVPLLDIAAVSGVQVDMLNQLAKVYGVDHSATGGKTFVAALTSSTFARIGASVMKTVPGIGTLFGGMSMAALSGASTYTVGKVATGLFESGGDLITFDLEAAKAAYKETFEEGKRYVADLEKANQATTDTLETLEKLSDLKQKGVITEADFDKQKEKLLDRL